MNVIDIVLSAILIFSFIYGLYLGLVSIFFPIFSLFITVVTTPNAIEFFTRYSGFVINGNKLYTIISYILVFIIVRLVFLTFEKHIKKLFKTLSLGFVEKILGGITAVLITSVLIVLLFYVSLTILKKDYTEIDSTILKILFHYIGFITKLIYL